MQSQPVALYYRWPSLEESWHDLDPMINYSEDTSRQKGTQHRGHGTVLFPYSYEKHHFGFLKTEEKGEFSYSVFATSDARFYNCYCTLWHV